MRIEIDLSDIKPADAEKRIMEEIEQEMEALIVDIYTDVVAPAPMGTPVDTGAARNSWKIDTTVALAPEVYSDSPYMGRLNDGYSKQSPPGFIDAIVDTHTRD